MTTAALLRARRVFGCAVVAALSSIHAGANEPPAQPILNLEVEAHTAAITAMSVDTAGRYGVSASADKTARVWDLSDGRLLRVLRPPQGPGQLGILRLAAISGNGAVVALSGLMPANWNDDGKGSIYLFDRASGRMINRIPVSGGIESLTFSPDGRWLAMSVCSAKPSVAGGVTVWDFVDKKFLSDIQADRGCPRLSWGGGGNDIRLVAAGTDRIFRLYRTLNGTLSKALEAPAVNQYKFGTVSFSPDGRLLAVSYPDWPTISILNGQTLRPEYAVPVPETGPEISYGHVAWSHDGRTLFARSYDRARGASSMYRWGDAGRGAAVEMLKNTHELRGFFPLVDGGGLFTFNTSFAIIHVNGQRTMVGGDTVADFLHIGQRFRVSADGSRIQYQVSPLLPALRVFDLGSRRLTTSDNDSSLTPPRTTGLAVSRWQDEVGTRLNGVDLGKGEVTVMSRALAVSSDAQRFLLGYDSGLTMFGSDGKGMWSWRGQAGALGVNIPTTGKVVLAALGDGTIRWYRATDGKELLAFFPHADGRRWVLWTPSGYYDESPGGASMIGWNVNRGGAQAADFFPASKFRDRFYRPDVIDHVLATLDESEAVAAADAARGSHAAPAPDVALTLPPVIDLDSPAEVTSSQSRLSIRVNARSGADAPVTSVFARVDGQAQPASRDLTVVPADGTREIRVDLPPYDCNVQLFAENRFGVSSPVSVRVHWSGAAQAQAIPATADSAGFQVQPKLYVVAVGVAAYLDQSIPKLTYAAKDARDLATALKRQQGKLYGAVEVKVLTDGQATKDNVLDALDWLQKQVTQHDVGILFLSGHGANDSSLGYVFLPVNADPDKLKRTALTMADIRTTLNSMPGKVIAFLDTCHSGNVFGPAQKGFSDITGVINDLASAENGVVVFSSSTGRQSSLEDARWNNGAFTKALIEGLDGQADEKHSGRVTFKMLDWYVSERVKALTSGKQSPVTQAPGGVNDFPLAVIGRTN